MNSHAEVKFRVALLVYVSIDADTEELFTPPLKIVINVITTINNRRLFDWNERSSIHNYIHCEGERNLSNTKRKLKANFALKTNIKS